MPTTERPRLPRSIKVPRRVTLRQADFANGPYVASEPDVELVLAQDVTLNFAEPAEKVSPNHLGFFAGIVIGAPRITLNLNRKTLRMHPNFRERQRFFALISLDVTPFPPGKMRFTTEPKAPTDITVRNGSLGLTSHFCVHGNTLKEGRILISDVSMDDFEVGAVSISGASDITIRRCTIGSAVPPTMTSDVNMLRDLARTVRERGSAAEAEELMNMAGQRSRNMTSSDAIVRAIVVMPEFNVNGVPDVFEHRIHRVAITDCTFEDLRAEPVEIVGIATTPRSNEALKDVNGNLIALEDARAGVTLSRLQAAFNPELPRAAREKLMSGPTSSFFAVHGQDRRGHSLQGKSSLFARIDGCNDVTLRNLSGSRVQSWGEEGAAVGFMLNGCERITITHVRVGAVQVHEVCSDPLSNERPQSGVLLRRCQHVAMDDYVYESEHSCGSSFRETRNALLTRCVMNAPSTFLKCKHVVME